MKNSHNTQNQSNKIKKINVFEKKTKMWMDHILSQLKSLQSLSN